MGSEAMIRLEVRLSAIEFLLTQLFVGHFEAAGLTTEDVEAAHRAWSADALRPVFGFDDPALSDHVTAEWDAALERLLAGQRAMLAQAAARRRAS